MKQNQRRKPDTAQAPAPSRFVTTYNEAVAAVQHGRLTDAANLFGAAAKMEPGFPLVHLAHGSVLLDLGQVDAALDCYHRVLSVEPGHTGALNERARALLKVNRFQDALAIFDSLMDTAPADGKTSYNRAAAYSGLGQHQEALGALDDAIRIAPDLFDAWFFRGVILEQLGQPAAALEAYTAAVAGCPERADFNTNLGNVLLSAGRLEEALACYDKALATAPNNILVLFNRGRTLGKLGQPEQELASLDRALPLAPGFGPLLIARGYALHVLKREQEALESLDQALAADPNQVTAWQERAMVLLALGRREDALANLAAGLELAPDSVAMHNNRGVILRMLNRFEEAAEAFVRVLELDPNHPSTPGDILSARLNCCDWTDLDETIAAITQGIRDGRQVAVPFQLLQVSDSPGDILTCARLFSSQNYIWSGQVWTPPAARTGGRLRVAYLSADFRPHATAFLTAGLFEAHDHAKYETIAVSFSGDDGSPMRRRLVSAFDSFVDISSMTDATAIAVLRNMRIDIAVDLSGLTGGARPSIFVERIAPVQVGLLAYPCTWGSDCMDYLIADERLIPQGQEAFYTESIVRLPDTFQPNDRQREIAAGPLSRSDVGLPEEGFVFCCFNAAFKIQPPVFDIWMRLLQQIKGSVLWLLETNPAVVRNLRREAVARGVSPERLVFAPPAQQEHHLARQRLADLFLDTSPYTAHTTASDALWAGLPLLTCAGHTFAGRVPVSVLHAVGLPELITDSLADYEAMALRLATTPSLLADLTERLARTRLVCPLFDTQRYCRQLEAAFLRMHERYGSNLEPADMSIAATG